MRRSLLFFLVVAALALPTVAAAKGPDQASITGPGLDAALSISGTEGSGDLGVLVQGVGFFPAAFGQSPNPMLSKRPARYLGPRYQIVYRVPGPNSVADTLRQDVYPYAVGGPVSYMKPGQPFWEQQTRGGWFRGTAALKRMLIRAGLPAKEPSVKRFAGRSTEIGAAAAIGIALAGMAAFVLIRRKH
jgi:hypothetical protein